MCVFNVIVKQMSKSRGNVVDPFDRLVAYSSDGLRFYLMKDGVAHSDGSLYSLFLFASFFTRATYTYARSLLRQRGWVGGRWVGIKVKKVNVQVNISHLHIT